MGDDLLIGGGRYHVERRSFQQLLDDHSSQSTSPSGCHYP